MKKTQRKISNQRTNKKIKKNIQTKYRSVVPDDSERGGILAAMLTAGPKKTPKRGENTSPVQLHSFMLRLPLPFCTLFLVSLETVKCVYCLVPIVMLLVHQSKQPSTYFSNYTFTFLEMHV